MSLINQMLKDLDARRAVGSVSSALPSEVRPFHPRRSSYLRMFAAAVVLLALGAGGALWYADTYLKPPPPPVPPVLPVRPIVQAVPDKAPAMPEAPVQPSLSASPDVLPEPVAATVSSSPAASDATEKPAVATAPAHRTASTPVVKPVSKPSTAPVRAPAVVAAPVPTAPLQAPAARPQRSTGAVSIEKSLPSGNAGEAAEVEYRRALATINQGRTAESLDSLRMALKLNAAHLAARQLLLKLLIENKQLDEADGVLHAGLALHPGQLAWAMSLARLQLDRGDLASAWKTLAHSLPAAGANADYQGFAGHLLQRQGRIREAIDCYQLATRLAPTEGRWWLGLGLALEADGRGTSAREAFANAKASGSLSADLQAYVEQKLR